MELLINNSYGGFDLSDECDKLYLERTGKKPDVFSHEIRYDPVLIAIFKENGAEWCSGYSAKLEIITIPMRLKHYYVIHDYDGKEWVRVNGHHAISDCTTEYLKDPTPEKLEWLKQQVTDIKSCVKPGSLLS